MYRPAQTCHSHKRKFRRYCRFLRDKLVRQFGCGCEAEFREFHDELQISIVEDETARGKVDLMRHSQGTKNAYT